jgi:hypothetical protein
MSRQCPDRSGTCIAPRLCRNTKPCWWLQQKRDHDIITRLASGKEVTDAAVPAMKGNKEKQR